MVIVRPFSCGRVFAAPADTFGECLPFDFARLHLCLDGVRPEGSRQHDRRLAGIQAVQTLSRLNRAHPGKDTTYVLDFVNSSEEVLAAFSG